MEELSNGQINDQEHSICFLLKEVILNKDTKKIQKIYNNLISLGIIPIDLNDTIKINELKEIWDYLIIAWRKGLINIQT